MNPIRTLFDSGVPVVAVSFRDDATAPSVAEARQRGVDIAELRIDQFSRTDTDHVLARIREFRDLPVLATIRCRWEGGDWHGGEAERRDLFAAVLPAVDAVDVELSSREILADVVGAAKRHDKVVIVSYHNFTGTPGRGELESIVVDARKAGADHVKVSTMATSPADLKTLAALTLAHGEEGLIVIAMGASGTLSRVFFPALGSRLTYSFMGERTAPGQLDYAETCRLLRTFYPEFDQKIAGRADS